MIWMIGSTGVAFIALIKVVKRPAGVAFIAFIQVVKRPAGVAFIALIKVSSARPVLLSSR